MSPTTTRQRGKANPELKRSRSQGTQRKLVKAQSVASTEDPNYGGGAVYHFCLMQLLHICSCLHGICFLFLNSLKVYGYTSMVQTPVLQGRQQQQSILVACLVSDFFSSDRAFLAGLNCFLWSKSFHLREAPTENRGKIGISAGG